MLNLDETLEITTDYTVQKDLYLKASLYSIGVIVFIDIVRSQIAEINLLQLIPGFFLILLFISFLLLVIGSTFFYRIAFENDNKKEFGTKTNNRLEVTLLLKITYLLLFLAFLIAINTIIPLSLDSFNFYGEKTLENIWSFDEVLNLEVILLVLLIFLSQVPITGILTLSTEIEVNFLPEFWKPLSLVVFLIAGLVTPTIDGYTQLSFALSAISLYLMLINVLEKRLSIKFNGISSFYS